MDSYNLFGDDGSGMLEGLTDLGGTDSFTSGSTPGVAGENKDNSDNSYRQPYNQSSVAQEGSIQKLASFGGSTGAPAAGSAGPGPPAPDYHEYGAYPPRPPRPSHPPHQPHAPLHPSHHVHPSHAYPTYHPGPDAMYAMPEQPGIGDMWSGPPGANRYSPITPGYRHNYEHQQKMHQYPPQQQGGSIAGLQPQNSPYLPRQPHFSQPTSQQLYGQQQSYPNYTQMHPPATSRINQHPAYHQQLDVNAHQYGIPHGQQGHSSIPQHQSHQNLGSHGSSIAPSLQGHPSVHLHHAPAPPLHHVPRQSPAPPSSATSSHSVPAQMPYASPHHSMSISYQSHQIQHPLDVNVSSQYGSVKPTGLETGSPQYRPPFPQLSPQMSPRAQISPRQQQTQSQLSPRPVMSPVKGPSASPHNARNLVQSPVSTAAPPPASSTFSSQNTLQALEQMVLPTNAEYTFQRNPSSPAVGHVISSPSQWNQNKLQTMNNLTQLDNNEQVLKPSDVTVPSPLLKSEQPKHSPAPLNIDSKINEKTKSESDRIPESNSIAQSFRASESNNITHPPVAVTNAPNEIISTETAVITLANNIQASTTTVETLDKTEKPVVGQENIETMSTSEANKTNMLTTHAFDSSEQNNDKIKDSIHGKIDPIANHPDILPSNDSGKQTEIVNSTQKMPLNQGTQNIVTVAPPQNKYESMPPSNINRHVNYQANNMQNVTLPNLIQQPIQPNIASSGPLPPTNAQNMSPVFQNRSISNTLTIPSIQNTTTPSSPTMHQSGSLSSTISSSLPVDNTQNNLSCVPNIHGNISNMQGSMQPGISNVGINIPQNNGGGINSVPVQALPMSVPNVHQAMQNTPTNIIPNIPHNMNSNMIVMGANTVPHPNMPGIFIMSHNQERAALQQQIQEMYCLPASNENQEKVRCLQERLSILQQHESNDKCNGGPNCLLQNPVYGSKMIESPQVSSTTGRGRGKGPAKPRKPRAKKEKNVSVPQSLEQLPVSEDFVTAGTGLQGNPELDPELAEDVSTLDSSALSIDDGVAGKARKRGPRKTKERKPRVPKEQKLLQDGEKPVKERKKREKRDPNAPRRKRNSKKDIPEIQADTTTTYDVLEGDSIEIKQTEFQSNKTDFDGNASKISNLPECTIDDSNVTDFDDIPVSKIAIKDLLEEAEAKREKSDKDDDLDINQRKRSKKRNSASSSCKKTPFKRSLSGRKKRRGGLIPDSDGEPDDLMSTPPPSPPPEADDSLKRRSARNTQRKKYTDDVMLRLSDEEFTLSTPKQEKIIKTEETNIETKDDSKLDGIPKPNYMYVNTTEEDSMIVQHVLAARMGKRELKAIEAISENTISLEKQEDETSTSRKDEKDSTQTNIIEENSNAKVGETIATSSANNINSGDLHQNPKQENKVDADNIDLKNKKPTMVDVEEYFVKYRNFSYLHCEWKTEEELYKGDKRIFSKIKRFKQKQSQQMNIFELLDDEPFNPDYVEVERILDMSENHDPGNDTVVKHYLVKWKSLQYEDSTWELEEDIDVDKIKQYKTFSEIPLKDKWRFKKRPSADQWVQLKESPLYKGGNTLRPYQLEGLNWLLFSWHNNRNCILADEMGLGKTIQSLTFVNSVWEYGIRGPFLIIAPLSTIPNWQREFEAWTEMNVIVYHGSQLSKSMIQEYEFYYKNEDGEPIKDITKFNVLITTFEIIVTDFQELKSFNWRICVIDEAHRLKNRNCKLLEGLRQLHLEHRVLLSGTPLQNNVNELFSLLNFLEPSQFSSSDAFLNEFGQLKTESEVIKLQALLKPMMLRRLKEDVEKTLAPKEETIIEVELTNIQKKYYRAILERNFSFLQKGTASAANIPNLMNTMMELRKCCIHPYLLNGAEDQIQFDYKQVNGEDKEAYYKALIQSSGKMVLVDKLLPKLKAGGHRVLIFSQMVRCLDILEDYLMFRKYPYERIDGRIRGNLRQEAIDRFSKPDSDRFVFLLCTKAGGLGINLTAADTVIIYDSDWNPQNDLQAQARCHRIGQQKMVKIYRLICRNTYEREMFDKASLKLGLDKAILQSMNTSQGKETGLRQLSKKEIEDLLKKGAYGAVMDEDNAGDKFCEEDIEMILARRTQVIQMESEKGSTFSKASFAATDQRSDIDIRDPDFWNKWAKKAEIDTTEKKEDEDLIVTEPRKRTVIKRYGHDDGPMEMSDMEVTPDSEEDEEGIGLRSKRKKDKLGKKGRKYASDDYIPRHEGVPIDEEVVYGSWTRSECFKIERGLLTFGWARWEEIVDKNQLRKGWTLPVIEDCARIIVLYCLRHYKGDEKIRNFIWDLIEPCENGEVTISRNHSGLHNPVPRGRNAKKKNKPKDVPKQNDLQKWEDPNHWSSTEKYDCEAYLESSYKKHLFRHANKVLLRVRMMYYIKHEVIGDFATQIESGVHASSLNMRVPRGIDSAPPRFWWDSECDVSLLVGTYIHGYENYLAMRTDPQLCFIDKLGPPDDAECTDIKSEERKVRGHGVGDEDCTDEVSSGAGATSPCPEEAPHDEEVDADTDATHPWPSMQDLNTRLRRLITAYQRNYKREELKLQQKAKKMERRERMDQMVKDEVSQWRWSRADEEAFRRTVASYGVEFDPATKSLRWGRFRTLARLDNKSDDALTDYLKAFMAMCKRQCGLSVGEAELPTRADLKAESIGEERAIATLERIDLLRVLREEVAPHPLLEARLSAGGGDAHAPAPPWWQPAVHDRLLVLGVCKHGLGDTYNKLFCDPKMPFAECASKWYATHKSSRKSDGQKVSSDEDEAHNSKESGSGDTRSLRRSKRTSHVPERNNDEDTDALSELETLAKIGRIEESLSPDRWFSERALETRLHHIAHAVQKREWPGLAKPDGGRGGRTDSLDERKQAQKRHIAIDVETDRAKLHALLSSPAGAHASSESSEVGPPPPPAHQRVAASPKPAASPLPAGNAAASASNAPVDLSTPLDLSEAHDFSSGRRTPQPADLSTSASNSTNAPRSRLDDTLTRLMKRKNVPAPEQIVGKEKKRKKLDEIVLGLSAAKSGGVSASMSGSGNASSVVEAARERACALLPDVTVTPAAPAVSVSHAPPAPSPKPFSVTVTNVPSPQSSSKELSSFLQQSLEQNKQKGASTVPMKSYSHEAKVNKWLAEQANVESRRRGLPPRLAPEEHVPVVHRVTGKRLVGHKAPQLKNLAHWIAENPMYDIDSKWTEGIKEHVKLPQDVRTQRHSPMPSPAPMPERKKGRPPTLDNPSSSAHLNQSLAGLNPALLASLSSLNAFDPKTLAATLSNLTGFDPKLLNTFDPKLLSSLASFDPKNNPLLNFNSMPNLLGNMAGGNIFANLAGLGLSGFSSLDMNNLSSANLTADNKSKSRKPEGGGSSSTKAGNSQFPFVFPNPNMLYPQLGLSGLNAFGMHSGMTSAYDALGLLGNNMATSSGATTMQGATHSAARTSTKSTTPRTSTTVTSSNTSRQQKVVDRQQSSQLPQIHLPPDPYLLETLSKQNLNYESMLRPEKRQRDTDDATATDLSKSDKRKMAYDSLRSQMPPEFAAVQEKLLKGDKKDIDISKMLLEQMASGALSASLVSSVEAKKIKDHEKDAYEKLNKSSSEYIARTLTSEDGISGVSLASKRIHSEGMGEPENLAMKTSEQNAKKLKDASSEVSAVDKQTPDQGSNSGEMDLEDLIAPSTVIKTGMKASDFDKMPLDMAASGDREEKLQTKSMYNDEPNMLSIHENIDTECSNKLHSENKDNVGNSDDGTADMSATDMVRKGKKKNRKSSEESAPSGPRRELRSSSGRQSIETVMSPHH